MQLFQYFLKLKKSKQRKIKENKSFTAKVGLSWGNSFQEARIKFTISGPATSGIGMRLPSLTKITVWIASRVGYGSCLERISTIVTPQAQTSDFVE